MVTLSHICTVVQAQSDSRQGYKALKANIRLISVESETKVHFSKLFQRDTS